ncbi:Crp/Fnr family transcriptional regulator [Acidobacteria bacterium AB60]|nr:Crp/Fnr family transcriptional regulator [Acidobacteria bacterium AB60]
MIVPKNPLRSSLHLGAWAPHDGSPTSCSIGHPARRFIAHGPLFVEDFMGSRIVHYGLDEHYRLRTLRNAGYTVDNCNSLSEFKWVLYSGGRADAVAFTEADGAAPLTAMSLARHRRSPLVLFQGWMPHYQEKDFNLVVPMLTAPENWLGDIAGLIGKTRQLVRDSQEMRARSHLLREETSALLTRTFQEMERAHRERQINRDFKVDFLRPAKGAHSFGIVQETNGFLAALSPAALREFRSMMKRSAYPSGTALFSRGQLPHDVWFIFAGAVKLAVDAADGRRFILHIARAGEFLGLPSAFACSAHQMTAEAGLHCDVGCARTIEFLDFLERFPEAFRAAALELGRSYNQTCTRLRTVGVNLRVQARLAGLLLEWAERGIDSERGTEIHLGLTQEEIGQCIGTTRESVTRILHDLQQRHIVEVKGPTLTIFNRAALENCAGGDIDE